MCVGWNCIKGKQYQTHCGKVFHGIDFWIMDTKEKGSVSITLLNGEDSKILYELDKS